jgi:hypothetical protein
MRAVARKPHPESDKRCAVRLSLTVRGAMLFTSTRGVRMRVMVQVLTIGFGVLSSCVFLAHAYDLLQDVAARPRG